MSAHSDQLKLILPFTRNRCSLSPLLFLLSCHIFSEAALHIYFTLFLYLQELHMLAWCDQQLSLLLTRMLNLSHLPISQTISEDCICMMRLHAQTRPAAQQFHGACKKSTHYLKVWLAHLEILTISNSIKNLIFRFRKVYVVGTKDFAQDNRFVCRLSLVH